MTGPAILVTGGAGFIGSHACKALAADGYRPVAFDSLATGHADAVRWGPLVRGDVRDQAALDAAFDAHRPVAVLHFAARAYVGESVREPGLYHDGNVGGTTALLAAMRRAGTARLVFSSSCATYGIPDALPIREDTPQRPINPYGRTKLIGEWMIRDHAAAHGLDFALLRYFNAAGADPEGDLAERHDPETHLIPNVLRAALGTGPALTVMGADYGTPDGTCVRDYVHVSDLARAHVLALRRLLGGGGSLAANLGTGRGHSVREVIDAAEDVTGRPVPHAVAPRRPGDPAALVADPSLARAVLGFRAERSDLRTMLADAAPHFAAGGRDAAAA